MKEVAVGIILREGHVLACQRKRDAKYALKWEFPGGKLEPGETAEHALLRELREELAIDAKVGNEFFRQEWIYTEGTDNPQREWSDVARTALQSWQSRKTALASERSSLVDELTTRLRNPAIDAARGAHGMSNVENVDLESRDQRTEGNRILITDVYAVRMKGAIFGMHIFKLRITTSGYIAIDEKRVVVNEKVNVQEQEKRLQPFA